MGCVGATGGRRTDDGRATDGAGAALGRCRRHACRLQACSRKHGWHPGWTSRHGMASHRIAGLRWVPGAACCVLLLGGGCEAVDCNAARYCRTPLRSCGPGTCAGARHPASSLKHPAATEPDRRSISRTAQLVVPGRPCQTLRVLPQTAAGRWRTGRPRTGGRQRATHVSHLWRCTVWPAGACALPALSVPAPSTRRLLHGALQRLPPELTTLLRPPRLVSYHIASYRSAPVPSCRLRICMHLLSPRSRPTQVAASTSLRASVAPRAVRTPCS